MPTRTSRAESGIRWSTPWVSTAFDLCRPADVQGRAGARFLLAGLEPLLVPRLKKIWADGAYSGKELAKWGEEQGGWELEAAEGDKEAKGFEVLPKRWVVERTLDGSAEIGASPRTTSGRRRLVRRSSRRRSQALGLDFMTGCSKVVVLR